MKRITELDVLKATAILLMVFTHVAMFFYDYTSPILNFFSDLGGNISFILFIFAAGGAFAISIYKHSEDEMRTLLVKRSVIFFILYIAVAILMDGNSNIVDIILLRHMPPFAEFIFAFSLVFLFIAAFLPAFKKIGTWKFILIGFAMYLAGFALYWAELPAYMVPVKAILFGHGDLHRFPIFQYAIVYILGFEMVRNLDYLKINHYISALLTFGLSYFLTLPLWGFERWQVSPAFLSYGLMFASLILVVYKFSEHRVNKLSDFSCSLSKRVSGILIFHILLIALLSQVYSDRLGSIEILILSTAILSISWFLGRYTKI